MDIWFKLVCYILAMYGISDIVTQSIGPNYIFVKLRAWAERLGPNIGMLFRCMWCFPTNLGIFFSLFNWFCLPIMLTPFNIIFTHYHACWYFSFLAALLDGALTGAICAYMFNIYDYVDKKTPVFADEVVEDEDVIEVDGNGEQ